MGGWGWGLRTEDAATLGELHAQGALEKAFTSNL